MKKISLVLIFLVVVSLACTTQTGTTDGTSSVKLYKGVEIDSLKSTATSVRENQQFSVQMVIKNIGEFKAKNIRGVLVSNIQTENIVTTSNVIQQLEKNEPRTMLWSINAPTVGIPTDVDYFLNTRVYYDYFSTGFSDVIFIPDNYVGTTNKVISDSSSSPIKITIESDAPIITYQESTTFDVTIDIENIGGGRVAYLKDDKINEDTTFKSIIKSIEIKYPTTWELTESEKWDYTCEKATASPIEAKELTSSKKLSFAVIECTVNSDCGAKCIDGVLYSSGTCASAQCSYSGGTACESGFCRDETACLDTSIIINECSTDAECAGSCQSGTYYAPKCVSGTCEIGSGSACASGVCEGDVCKFECVSDTDCGAKCTAGVYYKGGSCSAGLCSYSGGENCESGACEGSVCKEAISAPTTCGNEYIITSNYDNTDKTKYQRHHLISDNKLSIVLPFSRSLVSTETIENLKVNVSYGYAIDYPSSLKVTVKGG